MTMVAALAVISTQNSTVSGLSNICQGMAKMNMMPQFFAKTNKRKVPFFGVIFVSLTILIFAFISDSSSSAISFLILVGSVFWRKRVPNAPRSFKVPLGKILPLIGILGTTYMILNISTDPAERLAIWGVTGIAFLILGIYSFFWIKYKMRMPVFKSVPMEEVMAMENDLYYVIRKEKGIWR